jgi:hypothetical protein
MLVLFIEEGVNHRSSWGCEVMRVKACGKVKKKVKSKAIHVTGLESL